MKLLDKLKNALFEEEYVEVEEKPKAPKKEKPIAKKMVLPEEKKVKPKKKEEVVFEEDVKEEVKPVVEMLDDEPAIPEKKVVKEEKKSKPLYSYKKEKEKKKEPIPYGMKKDEIKIEEYGTYEKKNEKKTFQPSPMISPVFGYIDEEKAKEEAENSRREVRISSSYKSRRLDVDSVREKAYGNNDDIFEEELSSSDAKKNRLKELQEEEKEDVMLDITDTSPKVSKVTVGDAEEYFEDLGLEYNVDYKDVSHARKTGRRVDLHGEEEKEELEDNLFDLIDSMYEERKGE